ncbi:hypothetical protein Tco_1307610 [Tanacetum coccineum]
MTKASSSSSESSPSRTTTKSPPYVSLNLGKDYKVKKSKNKPKTDKKRKRQDKSEEWKPISKPDQPDNKERKSKLNYQVPRINNVKFSKFKVSFG